MSKETESFPEKHVEKSSMITHPMRGIIKIRFPKFSKIENPVNRRMEDYSASLLAARKKRTTTKNPFNLVRPEENRLV